MPFSWIEKEYATRIQRASTVQYNYPEVDAVTLSCSSHSGQYIIEFIDACFTYPETGKQVLSDFTLQIEENEFVSIVGASGCGKTTLIYLTAGYLRCSSGVILMKGQPVIREGSDRIVVFQQSSVFPWMRTWDNVAYGLRARGISKVMIRERADYFLALVGLAGCERLWPRQLSGGMLKRVEIARAYATGAKILLMDEPFGSLDVITREEMQLLLSSIWEKERKTVISATHDLEEAIFLADRVVVMHKKNPTIQDIVKIPFARPRAPEIKLTPEFIEYRKILADLIKT